MFAREDPFGRKDLASLRECRDICLCPYEGEDGLKAQQPRAQGKAKPTPWDNMIHKKAYALQGQQHADHSM